MATIRKPVAFLALYVSLGAVSAQTHSRGPLAGAPLAVAVQGGSPGNPDATTLFRRNGFGAPMALFPPAAASPNLQAILALYSAPSLQIDDISTGRDDIMVDSLGVISVPLFGWGFFALSFRHGAVGRPTSRLAAEPAGDRGAAVFTWVLPGSSIPTPLTDVVERSHSRSEFGLAVGADLDSIDQPLVLGFDQVTRSTLEPGFLALRPLPDYIYFTVSNASLNDVPAAWWSVQGVSTPHSGATIFRTQTLSLTSGWSRPVIYRGYWELGLQQADDIDALALDDFSNQIIFSCVGTTNGYDQLMYVDASTDGVPAPTPVKKVGNTPVSQAVGAAGNDDIDAVCTLDPQSRLGLYTPDDFGASCGTPRAAYMPNLYPVGVDAVAFRRYSGGQRFYDTHMIGFPPRSGVGPGVAALVITLGDTLSPAITAQFSVRNPTSALVGDPQLFSQGIPAPLGLSGLALTFRWFAMNASGTELVQAYPLKVFL